MREKAKASIPATGPTPLDEIRQAESAAASQLFQVRQEVQARKQTIKKQAAQLIQEAQQEGERAGQSRCEQMVEEARFEAVQLVAQARLQADALTRQGQNQVEPAVQWALNVVLGLDGKDGQP